MGSERRDQMTVVLQILSFPLPTYINLPYTLASRRGICSKAYQPLLFSHHQDSLELLELIAHNFTRRLQEEVLVVAAVNVEIPADLVTMARRVLSRHALSYSAPPSGPPVLPVSLRMAGSR